jgi:hypothetical protein
MRVVVKEGDLMRRFLSSLFLLLLLFPFVAHSKKKDPSPSALFRQARFVYVEAVDGDEFNPHLYPEDRRAIADIREALQKWNRYQLTIRRQDADLIFVVRKGRLADAKVFGGVHLGPRTSPNQTPNQSPVNQDPNDGLDRDRYPSQGTQVGVGAGAGPPDDFLYVNAMNPDGRRGARIWLQSEKDGLETPDMPLFQQIKDAVDKAYPR